VSLIDPRFRHGIGCVWGAWLAVVKLAVELLEGTAAHLDQLGSFAHQGRDRPPPQHYYSLPGVVING
jgi:hypothetical protein